MKLTIIYTLNIKNNSVTVGTHALLLRFLSLLGWSIYVEVYSRRSHSRVDSIHGVNGRLGSAGYKTMPSHYAFLFGNLSLLQIIIFRPN